MNSPTVGDLLRNTSSPVTFETLAVHGEWAWIAPVDPSKGPPQQIRAPFDYWQPFASGQQIVTSVNGLAQLLDSVIASGTWRTDPAVRAQVVDKLRQVLVALT